MRGRIKNLHVETIAVKKLTQGTGERKQLSRVWSFRP